MVIASIISQIHSIKAVNKEIGGSKRGDFNKFETASRHKVFDSHKLCQ